MNYYGFKCWGCSFAINSKGDLKPCLWSDQVFSPWKEGEISHLLIGDSGITLFYVDNSLENIETCKDCIIRYIHQRKNKGTVSHDSASSPGDK